MRRFSLFLTLSITLILASGCGNPDSRPLAKIGKKVITAGDFDKRISKLPEYYRNIADQRKKDFLEDMINEQLLYKEALKRRLNKDRDVRELIDEARRKILIAKLLEQESKKSAITDKEVEEFYEAHRNEFITPLKLRASHIMVDTEGQAQEIKGRLAAGEDFAALAREYSKDPSFDRDGDIGYFVKGQLLPEMEEVCLTLKVGQTSDIIKTKFGYHIIMLTDRVEPRAVELSEVKGAIEKELSDRAQKKVLNDLIENLRSRSKVKIYEGNLEAGTE